MQFFDKPMEGAKLAVLETTKGSITLMFFEDAAPLAVENFLTHAQNGYYDHVLFHRVIPGFMVQSGDPEGTGRGGKSIWGGVFRNEVSDDCRNYRGALAMANAGPDTNGSQFYIVQAGPEQLDEGVLASLERRTGSKIPDNAKEAYLRVGGAPWLDGGYTVFGRVIDGMNVVDAIAAVETGYGDRPVQPVYIERVTVQDAPAPTAE